MYKKINNIFNKKLTKKLDEYTDDKLQEIIGYRNLEAKYTEDDIKNMFAIMINPNILLFVKKQKGGKILDIHYAMYNISLLYSLYDQTISLNHKELNYKPVENIDIGAYYIVLDITRDLFKDFPTYFNYLPACFEMYPTQIIKKFEVRLSNELLINTKNIRNYDIVSLITNDLIEKSKQDYNFLPCLFEAMFINNRKTSNLNMSSYKKQNKEQNFIINNILMKKILNEKIIDIVNNTKNLSTDYEMYKTVYTKLIQEILDHTIKLPEKTNYDFFIELIWLLMGDYKSFNYNTNNIILKNDKSNAYRNFITSLIFNIIIYLLSWDESFDVIKDITKSIDTEYKCNQKDFLSIIIEKSYDNKDINLIQRLGDILSNNHTSMVSIFKTHRTTVEEKLLPYFDSGVEFKKEWNKLKLIYDF